jgi:hypothetical protein
MAQEEKKDNRVVGQVFYNKVATALNQKQNPGEKSPEDEAAELKKKTEAAKARAEYSTTVEQLTNPESVQKIREQRESELVAQANAASNEAKEAKDRERERLEKDKDTAEQAAAAEQQKREEAEKALQTQRDKMLLDKLEELKTSQKPIAQQLTEYLGFIDTINEKFGLPKIGAKAPDTTAHTDPHITLEIEKLRIEDNQRQREFELKMAQDKKGWDLQLMTFQREGEWKKQELDLAAKKADQLFQLPQVLGAAIAKGLIDHQGAGAGAGAGAGNIGQPAQSFHIEIPEGTTGTIPCPNCKTPIGVGPTQTLAECINCKAQYPITRVAQGAPQGPGSEPLPQNYAEEDK